MSMKSDTQDEMAGIVAAQVANLVEAAAAEFNISPLVVYMTLASAEIAKRPKKQRDALTERILKYFPGGVGVAVKALETTKPTKKGKK